MSQTMATSAESVKRATLIGAVVKFGTMHPKVRLVGGEVAALLVAGAGGWAWAASGRRKSRRALNIAELRNELLKGHNLLLDARLSVFDLNFGSAGKNLMDAKSLLLSAGGRLKVLGRRDAAAYLKLAVTAIDEAQRLAAEFDQSANSRAHEAARVVADVLDTEDTR